MLRIIRSPRVLLLVLLAVTPPGVAGCQGSTAPSTPPAPNVTPTPPKNRSTSTVSMTATNWFFEIQPLQADGKAGTEEVVELGRKLFSGMSKDPKTLELLKRLNGDKPVELVVVPSQQAEEKAMEGPPSEGFTAVVRVTEGRLDQKHSPPGGLRFDVAAVSCTTRKDWDGSSDKLVEELTAASKGPVDPFSLALAMEDYVARHAPGWTVRSSWSFRGFGATLPASVEEQRKDLERWAQEYARRAHEFYEKVK